MGFESTSDMETKEFCGAAWPSKVLKGKRGIHSAPLMPRKILEVRTGGGEQSRPANRKDIRYGYKCACAAISANLQFSRY